MSGMPWDAVATVKPVVALEVGDRVMRCDGQFHTIGEINGPYGGNVELVFTGGQIIDVDALASVIVGPAA